ncbi:MAG: phospholipase D-like domain-containing protein, partial [Betaproteobacteria bacterium]
MGIVVVGDCTRALGDLARERWRRATGKTPRRSPPSAVDEVWPSGVASAAMDVDVAIARTEPAFAGREAVAEVRMLHEDAIAAARRFIYAENQYFTSHAIAEAFAARLGEARPPEIAVVSPYSQSGWLEITTMGVLRSRIHRKLRAADRDGKYRLYCPILGWQKATEGCLNVHSKVLIVDDTLLTVGSSNLADRSLSLDTECHLVIEAGGTPRRRTLI